MAEIQALDPDLVTFEMDTVRYTKADFVAAHLSGDLEWLRTEFQLHEIQADVEASSPKVQICKIALLKLVVSGQRFITTCGYLPRPDAHFYDLIETALGAELFHVLVNPSIATHVYRICRRGRFFAHRKILSGPTTEYPGALGCHDQDRNGSREVDERIQLGKLMQTSLSNVIDASSSDEIVDLDASAL